LAQAPPNPKDNSSKGITQHADAPIAANTAPMPSQGDFFLDFLRKTSLYYALPNKKDKKGGSPAFQDQNFNLKIEGKMAFWGNIIDVFIR
jgi:hypothetical protein